MYKIELSLKGLLWILVFFICEVLSPGKLFAAAGIESSLNELQLSQLKKRFAATHDLYVKKTAIALEDEVIVRDRDVDIVSSKPAPGASLRNFSDSYISPKSDEFLNLMRVLVVKAIQHSPELRVTAANVLVATHEIDEVAGRRWPQVRIGFKAPFTEEDNRDSNENRGRATLSINTNVWDWGRNQSDIRSAVAGLTAAELSVQSEREQVALTTASELVGLVRAEQSFGVVHEYVIQLSQRVDMLSKIVQSDKGRGSELVQARAKLLSAQVTQKQIENQIELSRIKLNRLLGEEAPVVNDIPLVITPPMVGEAEALASLDKHPLLKRLEAKAELESERANSLKAQTLPGLSFVVSKEENILSEAGWRGVQNDWYAGLDVQWDVFSGGTKKAAQQAAIARRGSALEEYDKIEKDLHQEIKRLVQSRDNFVQSARDHQQLSLENDRVRKMFYEQWYNLGKRTLLDVLVAEHDYFTSRLKVIDNICDGMLADLGILWNSARLIGFFSI